MFSGNDVGRAVGADIAVSAGMSDALALWARMYAGDAPWLGGGTKSLNMPSMIASELARLVTIDMKAEVSGGARADFLNAQLARVTQDLRRCTEYACALGGLVFKPYVGDGGIVVDYIRADCFFPTAFDSSGRILGAVFADQIKRGGKTYTRLEYHNTTAGGYCIKNMAFAGRDSGGLGVRVPLGSVPEWATLEPYVLIENVDRPLFAYFKMPFANTVDLGSPLGVSVFSRATDLIEEADRQYSRLLWEMESGERALFVDDAAFKRDSDGHAVLPDKRLYRLLSAADEGLFEAWTPSLREENILRALDAIVMRIEDACGLARGTVSNLQTQARTATELKILRQRSCATVTDTQTALQNAIGDLVYAMDVWATLGALAPAGRYETSFEWDDSIAADREAEFAEKQQLVSMGVMQPWELRAWYFGETEDEAKTVLGVKNAAVQAD